MQRHQRGHRGDRNGSRPPLALAAVRERNPLRPYGQLPEVKEFQHQAGTLLGVAACSEGLTLQTYDFLVMSQIDRHICGCYRIEAPDQERLLAEVVPAPRPGPEVDCVGVSHDQGALDREVSLAISRLRDTR
jgi:hypothetical protein